MKADDVCERYSSESVGLTMRMLEAEVGEVSTTVLIEGGSEALRMLGELLLAIADEPDEEGFSISPFGAGRFHFSDASKLGVYIHRLPK